MTARSGVIADAAWILMLPTNFIVLVSSCFRVAHIQQKEIKFKLILDETDELSRGIPRLGQVMLVKCSFSQVALAGLMRSSVF